MRFYRTETASKLSANREMHYRKVHLFRTELAHRVCINNYICTFYSVEIMLNEELVQYLITI